MSSVLSSFDIAVFSLGFKISYRHFLCIPSSSIISHIITFFIVQLSPPRFHAFLKAFFKPLPFYIHFTFENYFLFNASNAPFPSFNALLDSTVHSRPTFLLNSPLLRGITKSDASVITSQTYFFLYLV